MVDPDNRRKTTLGSPFYKGFTWCRSLGRTWYYQIRKNRLNLDAITCGRDTAPQYSYMQSYLFLILPVGWIPQMRSPQCQSQSVN